jgi:hypothetical protein
MRHWCSRPGLILVGALVVAMVGAATTTVRASASMYDVPAAARLDAHELTGATAGPTPPSGVRERSVSPSDEAQGASTTRVSRSVATNTAGGVVDDALAYATRTEKLDHIFVPKHKLDPLLQQFGSREAVVQQMLSGVKGLTPAAGTFEIPVTISGQTVVVRGAVVDGVVKLGTAFTP